MSTGRPAPKPRQIEVALPRELGFLLEMHRYKVAYGGRFGAKCLGLGTVVIMADGTRRAVEDVLAGERVMGPDSKPRRVLATTRGVGPLYRIKQHGAMDYVVNDAHILSLRKSRSAKKDKRIIPSTGNPRSPNGRYSHWPDVVNIPVKEYLAQTARWKTHFRGYKVGLSFPDRPVSIDPYFLGVWLGDGTSKHPEVTTADPEIVAACQAIMTERGGRISLRDQPNNRSQIVRLVVKSGRCNPLWGDFKAYGLANNKHIPQQYLSNSETVRLQVLAGLLDTDGTRHHDGYVISQTNERLARDIKFLADGLGFSTNIHRIKTVCGNNGKTGEAWRVRIGGDTWRVPCRVPRKQIGRGDCAKTQEFLLSGIEVEDAGVGPWAGFSVDGDQLFLLGDGTVTHNTRSFAIALLTLGSAQRLRILCCREIMNSIRDSVHQELKIVIEAMGLTSFYTVLDNEIRGRNGTVFIFSGLAGHTVDSIKSYSGIDVAWVEEAQNVKQRSWDILIPTIRAPNSEIWVAFNPDMDTDDTWKRFIEQKPPGAVVVKVGWQTAKRAGWWTDTMEAERLHCLKTDPTGYPNIWEGQPKTVVTGAIYAREVLQMVEEGRIRAIPYDPRLPVHTIWDLGWNDAMTIIMVQKATHNSLNVINYLEDSFLTYAQYIADLNALKYVWGTDWLPHDAESKDPKSGTNAKLLLRGLGRKVKVIPRGDVEEGIKAARMMFPRVYIDDTARNRATGHLGGKRLVECLKRYRRNVPSGTGEPSTPVHDEYAHGADAWRYLATIVDQIRNDAEAPPPVALPEYTNPVRGMGMLG